MVLHGGGLGSMQEMGGFIYELRKTHKVIAISTRGHARSDIGVKPFSLRQRADDIMAVLNAENVSEPVSLLGFSDGGYATYSFAVHFKDYAKKLVTIDAGEVLATNKHFVFNQNEWQSYDAKFLAQQKSLMS
ncbi:alpha/beta hydrolase [Campylobacter sp. 9BO]|uniref:alpha/beta fold hydrolase n=1 Tax=Campylobacter sp. 9BO TaxID=3424759 RepID=UPI003D338B98